ncbi:MAG: class I SAM-dependent methyltransferase, partial [Candidatus Omnitrophota bacterium]
CLLCGSPERRPLYRGLKGVVKCAACGLVYTSPRLTKDAACEFYSQDYFESHSSEEMGYDNYVSDRDLVERTFKKRLERIEKRWLPSKGRLLDIGCAAGFFLKIARDRGWETHGVEISEYCCRYAADQFGLSLHHGPFESLDAREGLFDLITMWDYIEHSHVPDRDISKSYQFLKKDGLLAIATPDLGSVPARLFRDKWIGFKEHEHLYYFTRGNLTRLVERNGFKILHVSHIGKYISLNFFAKRLSTYSGFLGSLMGRMSSLPALKDLHFYCNPFDIVYVIAKKV